MAYFYKIMCVKKSAFKKVILSDFFKNTSLSCFVQPSGERQTHFAFFSPLSPSLFPFVQSNSFVMRQFLFPYICACVHSGKKRPHSLAPSCALVGNRLAWQPDKSLFSMILWDSCVIFSVFYKRKRTCRLNFYLTAGPLFYTLKFSF